MLKYYLKWSAINNFTTSISSVISTNSMLYSINIPNPSYESIITLNYVGKDIIGQFGSLLYSWKKGKNSDVEPLKHIIYGGIFLQTSFFIENLTPLITNSSYILPILGFSNIIKNISFISIGSVNIQNIQKISKGHNIGEIYSKIASINTIASTLGMVIGIVIIHFVPSHTIRTLCILPFLSVINIYSLQKMCILI
jgi:hypothetical protein